jgi:uncharacterized YigZ family protein
MSIFSFLTLATSTQGLYKEKGSKFYAFAYPVASELEVKQKLDELKKKYFDAHHHCYAYVLGADKSKFRAFDDGEPNHSAGDPILGQIRSKTLTNVLIVVVRYFGGTKLGVGGLISAYKIAAEDALNKATVIECDVLKSIQLIYEYSSTPEVMRLIKEFDIKISSQHFEGECELVGEVRLANYKLFCERILLLVALRNKIALKGTELKL